MYLQHARYSCTACASGAAWWGFINAHLLARPTPVSAVRGSVFHVLNDSTTVRARVPRCLLPLQQFYGWGSGLNKEC